jgi:hypothetical protein
MMPSPLESKDRKSYFGMRGRGKKERKSSCGMRGRGKKDRKSDGREKRAVEKERNRHHKEQGEIENERNRYVEGGQKGTDELFPARKGATSRTLNPHLL